jgi:hypothetical protein
VTFSQSEIYTLAIKSGLTPARAKIAAAIAMAESGGNPNAHNTNSGTGDNSYGLWQINMLGAMGPERRAAYGLKSNDDLFNPTTNAKVMSGLSKQGQNFNAWSTYKNGSHTKNLANAVHKDEGSLADNIAEWTKNLLGQGKDAAVEVVPGAKEAAAVADATVHAVGLAAKTAQWVSNPKNWERIAFVIGGGAIVITGTVMILKSTSAGKAAVATAGKAAAVVPGGAVVKGALK